MAARRMLVLSAFGLALTMPIAASTPQLAALGALQDGLWELRFRDGSPSRRICWHDPWRLIQLEHPDRLCDRLVLEDGTAAVSVQYTCRGKGFGRTSIRRESAQLIQLETQGIAGGLPFVLNGEGRRIGDCPPAPRTPAVATAARGD